MSRRNQPNRPSSYKRGQLPRIWKRNKSPMLRSRSIPARGSMDGERRSITRARLSTTKGQGWACCPLKSLKGACPSFALYTFLSHIHDLVNGCDLEKHKKDLIRFLCMVMYVPTPFISYVLEPCMDGGIVFLAQYGSLCIYFIRPLCIQILYGWRYCAFNRLSGVSTGKERAGYTVCLIVPLERATGLCAYYLRSFISESKQVLQT